MGSYIGETSVHAPAVVFDEVFGTGYHMLLQANDRSNSIIYATSEDGQNWADRGWIGGQTSPKAPALALYQKQTLTEPPANVLVCVFVADDPSNRMLYATLNLPSDKVPGWEFQGQVGGESANEVFALPTGTPAPGRQITVYFTSNDASNRILEHQFVPNQ